VAAPSANCSGRISPTSAEHVLRGLDGRIAAVIDCGRCEVGVESTVIDLSGTQPVLLRPGGVSIEALEREIGPIGRPTSEILRSPGMMASHYAPSLPLRLNAAQAAPGEALLGFGPAMPEAVLSLNLSLSGDLAEAAANLFEFMHKLDAEAARLGLAGIAAAPIPAEGLGLAINDRLFRAAAPRI
jgi:L-threonylcarbamoyladenylate synthase